MPKGKEKRLALVEAIGRDGSVFLDAIFTTPEVNWLRHIPTVETLRHVWVQQFERVEDHLHFRSDENIPPPAKLICSPYDVEATYGRKRTTSWAGYTRSFD